MPPLPSAHPHPKFPGFPAHPVLRPAPDFRFSWPQHPFGRKTVQRLLAHYAALRDVQTLAMITCICANYDRRRAAQAHQVRTLVGVDFFFFVLGVFSWLVVERWNVCCYQSRASGNRFALTHYRFRLRAFRAGFGWDAAQVDGVWTRGSMPLRSTTRTMRSLRR